MRPRRTVLLYSPDPQPVSLWPMKLETRLPVKVEMCSSPVVMLRQAEELEDAGAVALLCYPEPNPTHQAELHPILDGKLEVPALILGRAGMLIRVQPGEQGWVVASAATTQHVMCAMEELLRRRRGPKKQSARKVA